MHKQILKWCIRRFLNKSDKIMWQKMYAKIINTTPNSDVCIQSKVSFQFFFFSFLNNWCAWLTCIIYIFPSNFHYVRAAVVHWLSVCAYYHKRENKIFVVNKITNVKILIKIMPTETQSIRMIDVCWLALSVRKWFANISRWVKLII